jgi:hypothetical protein
MLDWRTWDVAFKCTLLDTGSSFSFILFRSLPMSKQLKSSKENPSILYRVLLWFQISTWPQLEDTEPDTQKSASLAGIVWSQRIKITSRKSQSLPRFSKSDTL